MAVNLNHIDKLKDLQTSMTVAKAYMDGIAEACNDALDTMDARISGYAYDDQTEDLSIPSSFCTYADENLTLF
jgi:hypothetical protein